MPWYTRRVLMGGAASVCIALVGVAVVWNTQRLQPDVTELTPVAATPAAESAPAASTPAGSALADSAPADSAAAAAQADNARAPDAAMNADQRAPFDKSRRDAERGKAAQAEPVEAPAAADSYGYATPAPTAAAAPAPANEEVSEVVVTGARGSLQSSMEVKREATSVVDAISAEDVGKEGEELASISKPRGAPHKSMAPTAPATRSSNVAGLSAGILLNPTELPPPAEVEGRDKFEQFEQNPIKRPEIEASACPRSRRMSTPPRTVSCASSSTRACCRRRTRCASRK